MENRSPDSVSQIFKFVVKICTWLLIQKVVSQKEYQAKAQAIEVHVLSEASNEKISKSLLYTYS